MEWAASGLNKPCKNFLAMKNKCMDCAEKKTECPFCENFFSEQRLDQHKYKISTSITYIDKNIFVPSPFSGKKP